MDEQVAELKMHLAGHPEDGVIIRGTGGVRKLRWAKPNRGKSAGARIIYYYHNHDLPIFLLAAYAKTEKIDITQGERNQIKKFVRLLLQQYHGLDAA